MSREPSGHDERTDGGSPDGQGPRCGRQGQSGSEKNGPYKAMASFMPLTVST